MNHVVLWLIVIAIAITFSGRAVRIVCNFITDFVLPLKLIVLEAPSVYDRIIFNGIFEGSSVQNSMCEQVWGELEYPTEMRFYILIIYIQQVLFLA
jgi:hypothetical protein